MIYSDEILQLIQEMANGSNSQSMLDIPEQHEVKQIMKDSILENESGKLSLIEKRVIYGIQENVIVRKESGELISKKLSFPHSKSPSI